MPIKSFRGILENGAQDRIRLSTTDGMTGFRIVKFQIIVKNVGNTSQDSLVRIWKTEQESVPSTGAEVDFSNPMMLACAFFSQATTYFSHHATIIFDNEVFNQDIYVTHTDNDGSDSCNYYIELEQLRLNANSQAVATLKDIRTNTV